MTRTDAAPDQLPHSAVEGLKGALDDRLVAVVLFGSRARGDHRPDSDWDLLVIAEGLPSGFFDRHRQLRNALPPALGRASMVAKTPEEFDAGVSSLYLDIALDGKILYDPRCYAAQHLERLRDIMERLGLYRQRTPAGDMWCWREPPPRHWRVDWDS